MTTPVFKAALWSAVSSAAQATEEKGSLKDQTERERAMCAARGWQIVVELVVPGHSREYSSLDAAMRDMPELAKLLDMARDGTINLVLVYDTNRFRGLQAPIIKTLMHYGVQVYSLTQPTDPVDPETFRYFRSDTQSILTHVGSLVSDVELAALRRRYDTGMPRRLERGLHWNNHLPFAYQKPDARKFDKQAIAEIIPARAALLLEVKRRYERGDAVRTIADWMNAQNVTTERGHPWTHGDINTALFNPWYAGYVRRNVSQVRRDLLTGKRVRKIRQRSDWVIAPGKHQPLWSWDDYEHLWELRIARAGRTLGSTKKTRLFSRRLICSKCGKRLRVARDLKDGTVVYRCIGGPSTQGHAHIYEPVVMTAFRAWLERLVADGVPPAAPMPMPGVGLELPQIHKALADLDTARARYQRALGRGAISDEDYDARLGELAVERAALERQLDTAGADRRKAERALHMRQDAASLLADLDNLGQPPLTYGNTRISMVLGSMTVDVHKITDIFGAE